MNEFALWPIAEAGNFDDFAINRDLGGHHEILRQCAGLIAADHRGAAEGFYRWQTFYQRVALGHALYTHGER